MSTPGRNRLLDLLDSSHFNGIDYVESRASEPTRLYVHFLNAVAVDEPGLTASVVGGERLPRVAVEPIRAADWSRDAAGRPLLGLRLAGRGDFSSYTLRLEGGSHLDPWYRQARFSFFAFCSSDADCQVPPVACPAPSDEFPAIDYLAKDYDSFRLALSEHSQRRFPQWRERAEADIGMVLMEALCAIGDELSYLQDRVHLEAALETATERRSLVRLARLVEYEPRPETCARTWLLCEVAAGTTALAPGIPVSAMAPDGSDVPFETGTGLGDRASYPVDARWGSMSPYWWDDDERCLSPGATSLYLEGHDLGLTPGTHLVIETDAGGAEPPLRTLVSLTAVEETADTLYQVAVTRIAWGPTQALTRYHDLGRTRVRGNLIPATQGRRQLECFAVHRAPPNNPALPLAIERLGPNSTVAAPRWQVLYPLRLHPLVYLVDPATGEPTPEIALKRIGGGPSGEWTWTQGLLATDALDAKYTLEPMAWGALLRTPQGTAYDYDGSQGATIRFGNGVFGLLPDDGDLFEVTYRVGRGALGNVAADTVVGVDPAWSGVLLNVSNPFPTAGGADAESPEQIRRRAPYAFRNRTYRAVGLDDYGAAVAGLDWVQRGGAVARWTGSWPSVFVTADPKNSGEIDRDRQIELHRLLNRQRLAGCECFAPAPRYVSFDLQIRVCAAPDAYRGELQSALRLALDPARHADGRLGFFHFDNFTLGTPFERSRLEAAIQSVPGVAGVLSIRFRRRGLLDTFVAMPARVAFAPGEIFRLDNNPSRPERGSYRLRLEGGK